MLGYRANVSVLLGSMGPENEKVYMGTLEPSCPHAPCGKQGLVLTAEFIPPWVSVAGTQS